MEPPQTLICFFLLPLCLCGLFGLVVFVFTTLVLSGLLTLTAALTPPFYICLTLFLISCTAHGALCIRHHRLVAETLRRNQEGPNLPYPSWPYYNFSMGRMIRFAEAIDKDLARKMKQLMRLAPVALFSFLGFAFLTIILGTHVFGES